MEIEVVIKSIYGNDKVYIADKALAETITLLTGAKTLSPQHIHALKMLGYTLTVILDQKYVAVSAVDMLKLKGETNIRSVKTGYK